MSPDVADATSRGGDSAFGGTMLACSGLWKVFGPNPERIVNSDEALQSREELMARTGCVAAVRDVGFSVREGEILAIMGLSGSGKSTLVRCLSRLIEPTAGRITLDGDDLHDADPAELREIRRHKVSMVFQDFGLLPTRTVVDNIAYGLEIRGERRRQRRERAGELIELVGLQGFDHAFPDQLSGGMKQRVGLARALAPDPRIMLLDEPFSALDPLIRSEMQEEVCRLQRELNKTMVFITHDLHEALRLGDRIGVMRDGAMVQVGAAVDLLNHPADDYVRDFTRDVPRALVLTAADICHEGLPAEGVDTTVRSDTLLRDLIPMVADGRTVRVAAGDDVIGVVTRDDVLAAIYGGPLEATTVETPR